MNRILTISAIAMFAVVLGVSAFAPAMADRASAPGQNRVSICHVEFDDEGAVESIDLIKVPRNAAHFKGKHPLDFAPTDVDGVFVCIAPAPVA